jgi:hypothetical protein
MPVAVLAQPDIDYHPDLAKYKARTARRLEQTPELLKATLPPGFPPKVEGPVVWEGKDWTSEDQWVYKLSDEELQEIEEGMKYFESTKFLVAKSYRHVQSLLNRPRQTYGLH